MSPASDGSLLVASVSLLAVQAFTHSYGENQRHIELPIVQVNGMDVTVSIPASPITITGHYQLFVISATRTPSIGYHIVVVSAAPSTPVSAPSLSAGEIVLIASASVLCVSALAYVMYVYCFNGSLSYSVSSMLSSSKSSDQFSRNEMLSSSQHQRLDDSAYVDKSTNNAPSQSV
jgi:hypothetical protein